MILAVNNLFVHRVPTEHYQVFQYPPTGKDSLDTVHR